MTLATVTLGLVFLSQPDAPTPAPQSASPPAPAVTAAPVRLDLAAVLAVRHAEPSVDELRAAATALVAAEPARARSLVERARRSAWLPEIRLRADRRLGRSEALDYPSAGPAPGGPIQLDTVDDVRYEFRATWDLGRLVFNPEELHAHAEALRMADVRMEVESLVIRLYFERRRLLLESAAAGAAPAADPLADGRRELRVLEIEAELDALSGGALRRRPPPTLGAAR